MGSLTKVVGTCEGGPCPTAFRTESGDWIFQGFKVLDPKTLEELNLPENETAIRLPDSFVQQLFERLLRERVA
jgi:hypothetical protein